MCLCNILPIYYRSKYFILGHPGKGAHILNAGGITDYSLPTVHRSAGAYLESR